MSSVLVLPDAELQEVTLEPRQVLGIGADGELPRVSIGRTEPTAITATTPGLDPELITYLMTRPEYRFSALRFTCSFRPGDGPLTETRIAVRLTGTPPSETPSRASTTVPEGEPIAIIWSMSPERLSSPIARTRELSLTPTVTLPPIALAAGVKESDQFETQDSYVIGTGKNESAAQWYFRSTLAVPLEGMHDLTLIVRASTGRDTWIEVMLAATIRRRLGGMLPYRAHLPATLRQLQLPR